MELNVLKLKLIWARISEKSQAIVFFPKTWLLCSNKPTAMESPCFHSLKFK